MSTFYGRKSELREFDSEKEKKDGSLFVIKGLRLYFLQFS